MFISLLQHILKLLLTPCSHHSKFMLPSQLFRVPTALAHSHNPLRPRFNPFWTPVILSGTTVSIYHVNCHPPPAFQWFPIFLGTEDSIFMCPSGSSLGLVYFTALLLRNIPLLQPHWSLLNMLESFMLPLFLVNRFLAWKVHTACSSA